MPTNPISNIPFTELNLLKIPKIHPRSLENYPKNKVLGLNESYPIVRR